MVRTEKKIKKETKTRQHEKKTVSKNSAKM